MSSRKTTSKPTGKELEILQIVWRKGPSSVKDVHFALGGNPSNGYPTILKLMQMMHEKGHLTRQKAGKLHLYKAVPSQENTNRELVRTLIETVFQAPAAQQLLSALE